MNKPNIIVAGILNTKGESVRYIAERVKAAGGNPQIMELSLGKECGWADIPLRKVLEPVGVTPEDIFSMDRAGACKLVTEGATDTILRLYREGRVHGIISTGGSMGTTIACTMMRALPIGIPKIMLSTEASGDVSMHVGTRDICMLYPIAETDTELCGFWNCRDGFCSGYGKSERQTLSWLYDVWSDDTMRTQGSEAYGDGRI